MASVRMTNELRYKIRIAAREAYEMAHPVPQPSSDFIAALRHAIYNSPIQTYYREMTSRAETMGIDKTHKNGTRLLVPCERRDPITQIELRKAEGTTFNDMNIKLEMPLKNYLVNPELKRDWGHEVIYIDDLREAEKTEILENFNQLRASVSDHHEKESEYNIQIDKLLDSCTTLKQLLEIWPAAESLVPSDKIQKMHVKVTRKQRAQQIREEISFDPSVANQTVLTAKMLGG